MADTLASGGRRVKVYVLNETGKWDDRGTGHVRVETDPTTKAVVLKVTSDDTGRVFLASTLRASHEAFYQMQEDNIISWTEDFPNGVPTEVALSFAEAEGCRELWDKICHVDTLFKRAFGKSPVPQRAANVTGGATVSVVQGDPAAAGAVHNGPGIPSTAPENLHHHANPTDGVPLVNPTASDPADSRFFDDNLDNSAWNADAMDDVVFPDNSNVLFLGNSPASLVPSSSTDAAAAASFVMPDPDRSGVEVLSRIMSDQTMLSMPAVRERIIAEVSTSDYVTKLCQVFRRSEQQSDLECLGMLYHVIRCLFIVGNNCVLEVLVNEKHLMDIVGCLEYDPERVPELERRKADAKRKTERNDESSPQHSHEEGSTPGTGQSSELPFSNRSTGKTKRNDSTPKCVEDKTGYSDTTKRQHHSNGKDITEASPGRGPLEAQISSRQVQDMESVAHDRKARDEKDMTAIMNGRGPPEDESAHRGDSPAQKNSSEETTSSGNFTGDGDDHPYVLRTHRNYLERKVSYKSVVPITDQNVVSKIHQNYRVAYIRDVILSRVFDDGVNNALSGVILCNNVDIIMYFISGSSALQELFDRLKATVENRRRLRAGPVKSRERLQKSKSSDRMAHSPEAGKGKGAGVCDETITDDNTGESRRDTSAPSGKRAAKRVEPDGEANSSSGGTNSPTILTTGESSPTLDRTLATARRPSAHDMPTEEQHPPESGDPKSSEEGAEMHTDLRNMLGFLRELCTVVKGQQPAVKNRFHQILLELGALEISVGLLLDKDPLLRSLCCDILSAAIVHDQSEVRAHILKNATQQDSSVPRQQGSATVPPPTVQSRETETIKTKHGDVGVTVEVAIVERPQAQALRDRDKTMAGESGSATGERGTQEKLRVSSPESVKDPSEPKGTHVSGDDGETPQGDLQSAGRDKNDDEEVLAASGSSVETNSQGKMSAVSADPQTGKGFAPQSAAAAGVENELPEKPQHAQNSSTSSKVVENQARVETDFPLLSAMIEVICQDKESGVALTVLDLLRMLLDPMSMKTPEDKNAFLAVFYDKFFLRFLAPVEVAAHPDKRKGAFKFVSDENVSHVCDLLSFCVGHHMFRSKYHVLGFDVGSKVVELVQHKRAHVRLSALRFVRTCVGLADDVYDKYVVEKNLLDPVMKMYSLNQNRDNLTSSAVLDLVAFLTRSNRGMLIKHIVEKYSEVLEPSSKHCGAFDEAKRIFRELEKGQVAPGDGKGSSMDQDQGNATGGTPGSSPGRIGGASGSSASSMRGSEASSSPQGNAFLGQLEGGEMNAQMLMHSNASFKLGAAAGSIRFGSGFFGHEMRMASEEEGFFCRLTESSDGVQKMYSVEEEDTKSGGGIANRVMAGAQGTLSDVKENAGTSIAESAMRLQASGGKGKGFKTGWRSVSVKKSCKVAPTGLRSIAVTGDIQKVKSTRSNEGKRRCAEGGVVDKGGCAAKGSKLSGSGAEGGTSRNGERRDWGGKAVRLSLSKSDAMSGELDEKLGDREVGVLLSESSEDRHSPRKRERVERDSGMETCTKRVSGRRSDSPPKRRRTEDGEDSAVEDGDGSEASGKDADCSAEVR